MTVTRSIPTSIAPVLEQLELDGDAIVTVDRLAEVLRETGVKDEPRQLAYELRRGGWLGSLRTRGAWEFLPAARGGAISSGDRFLEFRAQRELDPAWPGVLAMESAAAVLGLAQRLPEREVVSLPSRIEPPKAFAGEWRVVTLVLPGEAQTTVDRLPTWNLEGLVAGIAGRPAGYGDLPGLGQWLPDAAGRVDPELLIRLLDGLPATASQRAAYLLAAGGNAEASVAILRRFPPRSVARIGPRQAGGRFDAATQVSDTALYHYLTVGTGA
jgi:predicted transcriptional regulator of viral defense system